MLSSKKSRFILWLVLLVTAYLSVKLNEKPAQETNIVVQDATLSQHETWIEKRKKATSNMKVPINLGIRFIRDNIGPDWTWGNTDTTALVCQAILECYRNYTPNDGPWLRRPLTSLQIDGKTARTDIVNRTAHLKTPDHLQQILSLISEERESGSFQHQDQLMAQLQSVMDSQHPEGQWTQGEETDFNLSAWNLIALHRIRAHFLNHKGKIASL